MGNCWNSISKSKQPGRVYWPSVGFTGCISLSAACVGVPREYFRVSGLKDTFAFTSQRAVAGICGVGCRLVAT